ncbi:MAG: phosphatidylserine decarboxylase [Bacteroidota bacterium]
MAATTSFYRFLSLNIWGNIPSPIQRKISNVYANVYNKSFTKHLIKPYCKINYSDPSYLEKFRSASGSPNYSSFQDFFVRVYKKPPAITSETAWACEGLLCDYGKVSELDEINVKGDKRHVRTIFGEKGSEIPDGYYFSNVFLHNNNYHRIHAPVDGKIKHVEHITGDLVLLRPWIYKHDPSLPALRNERVNVTMEDASGKNWYLSIVGGPAVGTIVMDNEAGKGREVKVGQEIGKFLLGSTFCMAAPVPLKESKLGDRVSMGDPL